MTTELALTSSEQQELTRHEAIIARGIDTFVEVGISLAAIREARLYRATHQSFDEYCRERWELGRARAYQLIGAAAVAQNVSTIVDTPAPKNEAQVRPLSGLPAEEQRSVWKEAAATAPGGTVTGAHVQQVVVQRRGEKPARPAPTQPARGPQPSAPAQPAADEEIAAATTPPPVLTPLTPTAATLPPPLVATPAGPDRSALIQAAVLAALASALHAEAQTALRQLQQQATEVGTPIPDVTVAGPALAFAAQQLLSSPQLRTQASMLVYSAVVTEPPDLPLLTAIEDAALAPIRAALAEIRDQADTRMVGPQLQRVAQLRAQLDALAGNAGVSDAAFEAAQKEISDLGAALRRRLTEEIAA